MLQLITNLWMGTIAYVSNFDYYGIKSEHQLLYGRLVLDNDDHYTINRKVIRLLPCTLDINCPCIHPICTDP